MTFTLLNNICRCGEVTDKLYSLHTIFNNFQKHNSTITTKVIIKALTDRTKAAIKSFPHSSTEGVSSNYYCHNSTPKYVLLNTRIDGDMKKLAVEYFKRVKNWIFDEPKVEVNGEMVELISACHLQNTRYGNKMCRGQNYVNEEYYDDADSEMGALSENDILMNQMKIVFMFAVIAGVFIPIGIIALIIIAALLEALRVCLGRHRAKGM